MDAKSFRYLSALNSEGARHHFSLGWAAAAKCRKGLPWDCQNYEPQEVMARDSWKDGWFANTQVNGAIERMYDPHNLPPGFRLVIIEDVPYMKVPFPQTTQRAGALWLPSNHPLVFQYRNYRGEVSKRRVVPLRFRFGSSEYHKTAQWLMVAHDIDKGAEREFAMNDILQFFAE